MAFPALYFQAHMRTRRVTRAGKTAPGLLPNKTRAAFDLLDTMNTIEMNPKHPVHCHCELEPATRVIGTRKSKTKEIKERKSPFEGGCYRSVSVFPWITSLTGAPIPSGRTDAAISSTQNPTPAPSPHPLVIPAKAGISRSTSDQPSRRAAKSPRRALCVSAPLREPPCQ